MNSTIAGPRDLQDAAEKVARARSPEDLFGSLSGSAAEQVAKIYQLYRSFHNLCRPDRHGLSAEEVKHMASETHERLEELYKLGKRRAEDGLYGKPYNTLRCAARHTIKTKSGEYRVTGLLAEGDVAQVFLGEYDEPNGNVQRVCLKVASDPDDNELIVKEQKLLGDLAHVSLPVVLDTFMTKEGKAGSVLRYTPGLDGYSLRDLPLYQTGLKPRYHISWMLARLLSVTGFLHSKGKIHGNIEPGHLVINPHNHNVSLIGFCFSVSDPTEGDYIRVFNPPYSAPELEDKVKPHPVADIYSIGKSAIYLLGGDPETESIPDDVEPPLREFIAGLVNTDRFERGQDAWQLARKLAELRTRLYGEHQFVPLALF